MIELKTQYPYIDIEGKERLDLIKHFAKDEKGNFYYIKQKETGIKYEEAVDLFPCIYSYEVTNEKTEIDNKEEIEESKEEDEDKSEA